MAHFHTTYKTSLKSEEILAKLSSSSDVLGGLPTLAGALTYMGNDIIVDSSVAKGKISIRDFEIEFNLEFTLFGAMAAKQIESKIGEMMKQLPPPTDSK